MTRTPYSHKETNNVGREVEVTVVRTDDYETCEIAFENDHYPVCPAPGRYPLAFRTDVVIDGVLDVNLGYSKQIDAFSAAIRAFEEHGIILN